jgi:hypothetical protein
MSLDRKRLGYRGADDRREATRRRLGREQPDLLKRVEAGELTVYQGARVAGWTSPARAKEKVTFRGKLARRTTILARQPGRRRSRRCRTS